MASAFGGQRSIQLSYGCLERERLAKRVAARQRFLLDAPRFQPPYLWAAG